MAMDGPGTAMDFPDTRVSDGGRAPESDSRAMDGRHQTAAEEATNRLALRIFRGFRWRDCDDFRSAGLRSSFSRLLLVERVPAGGGGHLRQRVPASTAALRAGHAYLIPAGVRFDLHYRRGLVMYSTYLRLDGPFGDDLLASASTITERRLPAPHRAIVSRLAEGRHGVGDALLFRSVVMAAVAPSIPLTLQEIATRNRFAARYAALLTELDRLPPARASVTLLARRLGEPAGTLAKRFRRDLGIGLKTFLLDRLRVRLAEALGAPTGTIAEIAASLGFHDPFYFSRCCRRLTGLSPTAHRLLGSPDDGRSLPSMTTRRIRT
jgi:AraC-like DNA-binding protein